MNFSFCKKAPVSATESPVTVQTEWAGQADISRRSTDFSTKNTLFGHEFPITMIKCQLAIVHLKLYFRRFARSKGCSRKTHQLPDRPQNRSMFIGHVQLYDLSTRPLPAVRDPARHKNAVRRFVDAQIRIIK